MIEEAFDVNKDVKQIFSLHTDEDQIEKEKEEKEGIDLGVIVMQAVLPLTRSKNEKEERIEGNN